MKGRTKRIIGYALMIFILIIVLSIYIGTSIHLFGLLATLYVLGFIVGLFGLCWLIYKLISSKD
jgi:hypothetical protein